jgi:hypothetical protein
MRRVSVEHCVLSVSRTADLPRAPETAPTPLTQFQQQLNDLSAHKKTRRDFLPPRLHYI